MRVVPVVVCWHTLTTLQTLSAGSADALSSDRVARLVQRVTVTC